MWKMGKCYLLKVCRLSGGCYDAGDNDDGICKYIKIWGRKMQVVVAFARKFVLENLLRFFGKRSLGNMIRRRIYLACK